MVKSIGKSYLNFENDGLFATFNQPYNDLSYTVQSYDEHIYNSQLPLNDGVNCYDKNMSPGKLPYAQSTGKAVGFDQLYGDPSNNTRIDQGSQLGQYGK